MIFAAYLAALLVVVGAGQDFLEEESAPYPYRIPLGLDAPFVPPDNPISDAKVALGKLLFFEKRLSRDATVSCASCHDPAKGWTDQAPVSMGIRGLKGTRSAPTILNSAYYESQFWDGRVRSLEEQSVGPIASPVEMGFTHEEAVRRLQGIAGYKLLFKAAFKDDAVTIEQIAKAIASFERTVLTGNSAYDRFEAGEGEALTEIEQRGMALYFGKANCAVCHSGKNFSDSQFHNVGVGMLEKTPDLGRFELTKLEEDRGAFKTPTLRNLKFTSPYMHDGSQRNLEEVVEFYDRGGLPNKWLSRNVGKLGLSAMEKKELVGFLGALNGDPVRIEPPKEFPQ